MLGPHVLYIGDCLEWLPMLPADSIDAVVSDPPYGLGFMGKKWDALPPGRDFAEAIFRVVKPGAHVALFGGTRTYHRLAVALEDAGFELRDCLCWLYGTGFPKSLNVSKAIDKAAGAKREVIGTKRGVRGADGTGHESAMPGKATGVKQVSCDVPITAPATEAARQWEGWGTALKPAWEPILLARKPLTGTVAANVLEYGTGALNIDATRVETTDKLVKPHIRRENNLVLGKGLGAGSQEEPQGRWPANVALDEEAAALLDAQTGSVPGQQGKARTDGGESRRVAYGSRPSKTTNPEPRGDKGGPSRFFYCAKASKAERERGLAGRLDPRKQDETRNVGDPGGDNPRNRGARARLNNHPTVKPIALIRWLLRLVTPPGGYVLDPFAGSGTVFLAADGVDCTIGGIEREPDYAELITARWEGRNA